MDPGTPARRRRIENEMRKLAGETPALPELMPGKLQLFAAVRPQGYFPGPIFFTQYCSRSSKVVEMS
jgi:hypothetical protein